MVISGVVKSLIINFSPSLIWLPGAVRSVGACSLFSAGNIHYTCCVTELTLVKRWWGDGLKWKQFTALPQSCDSVRGAEVSITAPLHASQNSHSTTACKAVQTNTLGSIVHSPITNEILFIVFIIFLKDLSSLFWITWITVVHNKSLLAKLHMLHFI